MLKVERTNDFEDVKYEMYHMFAVPNLYEVIRNKCFNFNELNGIEETEVVLGEFVGAAKQIITMANFKTLGINSERVSAFMQLNEGKRSEFKESVNAVNLGLTFFNNEMCKKRAFWVKHPYISNDFVFNLLQYTFYAICILEEKAMRRFYASYTLYKNMIGISFSLDSEFREHTNILTYFRSNIIYYVVPTEGKVYQLPVKNFKGLRNKQVVNLETIFVKSSEEIFVCAKMSDDSIVPLYNKTKHLFCGEIEEKGIYRKKSEGGMNWLSITLGKGVNPITKKEESFNILNHSLICLAEYGIDIMKFAVIDFYSIFTIDHINMVHNDNRLENLRMVTNETNKLLRNNPESPAFDFFVYWEKTIKKCYKHQEDFDYRAKCR